MKYEQLSKISQSLEIFNDAKFLSLLDENTAIVQNIKTGSIHSLPFSFNENGTLEFHGEKSELLEVAETAVEESLETPSINSIAYAILKSKLNGNEEAYNEGVDFLKKNTFVSREKIESVTEDVIIEGADRVTLNEDQKAWVDTFSNDWEDKLSQVVESFNGFLSYGNLFENDEVRQETITELPVVIDLYRNKIEQSEALFKYSDKVIEWFESVKEAIGENYSSKIFSKINPLSSSWKSDLTKALVTFKKEVNEAKISIPEVTKVANKKHAELFESDMQVTMGLGSDRLPGSSTGENKLNFLKLSGVFSQTDLGKLIEDFEYVLGSWPHMNEDDLKAVSEAKNKIDYMYRTCMIDDEAVANIINSFNSKYGKDGRDKLADPLLAAGGSISPANLPAQPVGV